ncbi:MAG: hypothetical protein CMJ39_05630 [Phycisphaerae bacterium]|nr:hypothetical protein [Phycisphaerae bacterium]
MTLPLEYIQRPPEKTGPSKSPMLFLLHGYGADMHDLFGLANLIDPRFHIISPQAPHDLRQIGYPGGCAWFHLHQDQTGQIQYDSDGARDAVELAATFISNAVEQHDGDPNQVMVMGFSQGAMLAHALLLHARIPLAGIAGFSGRLVPELISDESEARSNVPDGLPVLVAHGSHDDLIPVQNGHAIRDFYESTACNLTWIEEPIGHGIGPNGAEAFQAWTSAFLRP